MDLLEHAAGVWARKWVVLGVALLVAVAVFAWRSTAPEEYVATTTVQVRLPDNLVSDPSSQVDFYAQTVAGLATSRSVVERALDAAGRDDDADDAADEISAVVESDPGFLTITGFGGSGQEAADLADSLSEVLVAEVASQQADDLSDQRAAVTQAIADLGRDRRDALDDGTDPFEKAALDREREALLGSLRTLTEKVPWRLSVVERATAPTAPAAPTPLRDALLAFILALILAAEAVVARRALRGSLSVRDPGKDAADVAGVPALVVRPDRGATALTPLLPAIGSARSVSVVQQARVPRARTAGLLAELLAARGDDVLLVDANPARATVHAQYGVPVAPGLAELRHGDDSSGSTALDDLPRVDTVHVLAAGAAGAAGPDDRPLTEITKAAPQDRVTVAASIASVDDLLGLVADLDGPVVLDVDAATTKRQLRVDVATVRGLGLDLVAVTVATDSWRSRGARRQAQEPERS